jgi:hypothetical protein
MSRKNKGVVMATMSRQHFQFIADTLANLSLALDEEDYDWIVWQFADELENTNERFDREKFIKACDREYGALRDA